ncbi:hypothetical protein HCN44_001461 [Aphidius gifuensis]|uniref:Uncharacterized protein n=1 Tax=Aphidius gifuensis TaxID=684658 RepID=A0A834XTW8_APHGI|nr:hypothetical protein HCN44_001461 [Aphidius gifuensis]
MKLKTINRVCKTNEGKLIPYKPEYVDLKNDPGESVEYRDSAINIIYDFVFTDSHFYRETKSLKLRLSNRNLIISPLAFRLSKLEHLEITPGSVMLDPKTFQRLNHLKSLKLKINDAIVRLYQVLPNFPNLESLELIEYKFEIDLGGNNIQYIGSSEFKNSIIIRLFLDDNIIDKFNNKRRWGLQTSTAVYFKYNHDESATTTNKNYTHCYESDQDIYVICKNTKYISSVTQKVLPYRLLPTTLAIYDNETWGIDPEAFVDLSIETLTIKSSADTFYVRKNSFMNMKKLKNLQLMTCLVILSEGSFLSLKDTLESLTLSTYEYDVYLCEVLLMLKKLKVLIIENNLAFHFHRCGAYNNSNYITVENLRYNGGSFKTVPSKSFESLKMLYHLAIHESSLEEISAGAFSGLENLRILNIQFNTNLTFIKKGVFDGLQKLDILLLMHNSISVIEDGVFMDLNKTVSLLDLGGNKIQSITQKTFEGVFIGQLDLANNQIMHYDEQYMKDGTLYIFNNNKIIYKDDSKVTKIQSSCHFQGLLIICVEDNVMTFTIEMGALVLNHAMKFVNISNNKLERITAGTFKGMICDYLDLSGNTILSHDRNILDFTEIKKSNINGRVSTRGHATKSEDTPINDNHVSWTNWGVGCDGKFTYGYKYARRTCPVVVFKVGTFKGMKCDYLDLSGNKISSHEINILGLADIKKWNINGHVGFQGHATKAEDP